MPDTDYPDSPGCHIDGILDDEIAQAVSHIHPRGRGRYIVAIEEAIANVEDSKPTNCTDVALLLNLLGIESFEAA